MKTKINKKSWFACLKYVYKAHLVLNFVCVELLKHVTILCHLTTNLFGYFNNRVVKI